MINRSLVPNPWWQVNLTVLPGLIILLGQVPPASPRLYPGVVYLAWAVMIFLILSSLLVAVKRRSLFKVPVWGFIPLGVLVGFFAAWGLISITGTLDSYPTCFLLLVVTGLLFARHNGLSVCLFVLAGGMVITSWYIEPGMYFRDSTLIFVDAGMTVLFTILTPVLVLRSRSILGQAVGLLFPIAAYSAAFAFALSSVSYIPISQPVSTVIPFIALFATIAIAAAVYAWISSRDFTAGEAQQQSANQPLIV